MGVNTINCQTLYLAKRVRARTGFRDQMRSDPASFTLWLRAGERHGTRATLLVNDCGCRNLVGGQATLEVDIKIYGHGEINDWGPGDLMTPTSVTASSTQH